jgi:hypothetical protein
MEYLSILAQIGTALTGFTLIIFVIQLIKEMRNQNFQALFYLHQYLSQDEFSVSRHLSRTKLYKTPYKDWTEIEKKTANKICASYDQAGLLISAGIMNNKTKELFLRSSWGESMCDQYEILKDYLDDKQTPNKRGIEFFCHFSNLYNIARQYHR